MLGVADAVDERVAQPDVGRGHVDLGRSVRAPSGTHRLSSAGKVEAFRDGAVAPRRVRPVCRRTAYSSVSLAKGRRRRLAVLDQGTAYS